MESVNSIDGASRLGGSFTKRNIPFGVIQNIT